MSKTKIANNRLLILKARFFATSIRTKFFDSRQKTVLKNRHTFNENYLVFYQVNEQKNCVFSDELFSPFVHRLEAFYLSRRKKNKLTQTRANFKFRKLFIFQDSLESVTRNDEKIMFFHYIRNTYTFRHNKCKAVKYLSWKKKNFFLSCLLTVSDKNAYILNKLGYKQKKILPRKKFTSNRGKYAIIRNFLPNNTVTLCLPL